MLTWEQICQHPGLRDLPFKVETDERGRIIMSPAKNYHGAQQNHIGYLLKMLAPDGIGITECAIETRAGVKVADVAWLTWAHFDVAESQAACDRSPAICIEIVSGSNTAADMDQKRALYFEHGAEEVWLCEDGAMRFFTLAGEVEASPRIPQFPRRVDYRRPRP
ncbi:MAG: Uma2 family endonuclease [Candidatus Competibacterales bacterium]